MELNKKIRILVFESGGWGGIAHYAYNFSDALSKTGQAEVVLLTDREYELERLKRNFSLRKESIRAKPYILAVFRVIRSILVIKPDVIHVQSLITARKDWLFFIIARLFNLKIIYTAHNILPHEDSEKQAKGMRFAFSMIYKYSRKIIVHSQYSKDRLIFIFGVPEEKISIIYHGDYLFMRQKEMTQKEARNILGIAEDKKVILQFGAIREYKGLDTLIYAFKIFSQLNEKALLLVAGKPIRISISNYKKFIKELDLGDKIILKDYYIPFEEVAVYFFAADIVVLPYTEIDMSGSLQLAYAFGKPVLASRSGSFPEMVEDGRNGYLFSSGDTEGLAWLLEKVFSDEALLKTMGARSREIADEKFSWSRIAVKTLELYKTVDRV
ncbi:MAG: glycosyltransferase family 4 protein [Candidatus Omnitrophica bacterium]|nr:glycosyltransferase family 4 protein [Candidatus Omnitrophota bacterium]